MIITRNSDSKLSFNLLAKNNLFLDKTYININKKRPSSESKNTEIKQLGQWLVRQTQNYKNKRHIMKYNDMQKMWEDFINDGKYKKLLT